LGRKGVIVFCGLLLEALGDVIPGMQPDDCALAVAALRAVEAERIPFADIVEGEVVFSKRVLKNHFAGIDRVDVTADEFWQLLEEAEPGDT